jgi:hypothetical protein
MAANAGDLEQARSNALQTVAAFRNTVISLEVKRIADSRVGTIMWEERCRSFYRDRREAHLVIRACPSIDNARLQIHSVFARAAATNKVLFDRMSAHIERARSVTRISELLQLMERNLILNSRVRARYAVTIMQHLRCDLNRLFGRLIDALHESIGHLGIAGDRDMWHRTVYRMTLGLTSDGQYHPNPIPVRISPDSPIFTYQQDYYFAMTHN